MANLNDIYMLAESIRRQVEDLPARISIAGNQVVVRSLSEVSDNLGTIIAGEFRSGNGVLPGQGYTGLRIGYPLIPYDDKLWNLTVVDNDNLIIGLSGDAGEMRLGNGKPVGQGFSGLRLAYPAVIYSSDEWNLAGIENDVLQVGINAANGKLYAGQGNVYLDIDGIQLKLGSTDNPAWCQIKWGDSDAFITAYDEGDVSGKDVIQMYRKPANSSDDARVTLYAGGFASSDPVSYLIVDNRYGVSVNQSPLAVDQYVVANSLYLVAHSDTSTIEAPSTRGYHLYNLNGKWYSESTTGLTTQFITTAEVQFPRYWIGWLRDARMSAGAIGTSINTASVYNFLTTAGDTTTANREYSLDVCLSTGTYKFQMEVVKGPDAGSFDAYMDSGKINGASPYDLYAATKTYNNIWTYNFNYTSPGNHVLKLVNVGKNASSSGYKLYGSRISIFRDS